MPDDYTHIEPVPDPPALNDGVRAREGVTQSESLTTDEAANEDED